MAIQVPQSVPNAPQAVNPFPIAEAYLNRQQNQQQLFNQALSGLGTTINTLHQQKLQNQLAALNAYASIAKAVGPDAANQVAGQIPMMPNWNPSQQPQTQPQTPPVSQGPNQDQQPSPYIAASINAGHPDVAGVGSFHSAPLTDLSGQIAALNAQMPNYANKGEWGAEQQKQLSARIQGLQQQQSAANAPEQFAATQANEERRFQQTQAQGLNKSRSEAVKTSADTLSTVAALKKSLAVAKTLQNDKGNVSIPFTGNLAASYAAGAPNTKLTFAKNQLAIQKESTVAAGIIEKAFEGRYNHDQAQNIAASFFPKGNQLGTPVGQQAIDRFQRYLDQMEHGATEKMKAEFDALAGGNVNANELATPVQDKVGNGLKTYSQYGQSSDGHVIGSNDGKTWFDAKTGAQL